MEMNSQRFCLVLTGIALLFANSFYSYIPLKMQISQWGVLFYFGLLIYGIYSAYETITNCSEKKIFFFLLFSVILSIATSFLFKYQSPYESLRTVYPYLSLSFLYCILKKGEIKEKSLINLLSFLAAIYVFIIVGQQFLNFHLFGLRGGTSEAFEIRNGIVRYYIIGDRLCLIPLFYYLEKWNEENKLKYLLYVLFFLIGIFFQTERMLIGSILIVIAIFLLCHLNKTRNKIIVGISAFFLLFVPFDFGTSDDSTDMITTSLIQIENISKLDDIRVTSVTYYMLDYNNSMASILLGYGYEGHESVYKNEIQTLHTYGLFREDIGIFGDISILGLIYVVILAIIIIRYILDKDYHIPLYIRYVFMFFLFSWILCSSITVINRFVLWPLILYLIDINREKIKISEKL